MPDHTIRSYLTRSLAATIEARVSTYLDRDWRITIVVDKADDSSHPAALLSDGSERFFVKIYHGVLAFDQLKIEVAALRLLTEQAAVLTPTVIDLFPVEEAVLVIMAAVEAQPWQPADWQAYGRALAQIHSVKSKHFGFANHGYWGSLYQDNRPLDHWPDFFWLRRVEPRLRASVDAGNLPPSYAAKVARLAPQLTELCGPPVEPALLHGDAHQNNIINTAEGPVFIDPALYYGHPEMDLAFVDFFAPVGEEFYAGYAEVLPIAAGFRQRRNLWRIPAWLAMVELDGPQHLAALEAALVGISG